MLLEKLLVQNQGFILFVTNGLFLSFCNYRNFIIKFLSIMVSQIYHTVQAHPTKDSLGSGHIPFGLHVGAEVHPYESTRPGHQS